MNNIFPERFQAIDQILNGLLERCPVLLILLAERNGNLISARGCKANIDVVALSALVTANLATSAEIARMTGQYASSQLVMREGDETTSFITEAGPRLVLFVQAFTHETSISWCRFLIRETAGQISRVAATLPREVDQIFPGVGDETMNKLLDTALDTAWTG